MDDLEEAFRVLSPYVPVAPYKVVTNSTFHWDSFPAVAKVASTVHKTDVGGVRLGLKDLEELRRAVEELLSIHPKVIVQPMIKGVEVFLGGRLDPHFGPTVSLGLGGVFVEIYNDVSTRLVPLEREDVYDMIDELRGKKALLGFRGIKIDLDALVDAVLGFSRFMWEQRPDVAEINPLIVNDAGAFAVDIRLQEHSSRAPPQ